MLDQIDEDVNHDDVLHDIAVSADSSTTWASLQENNAFAIVDVASATIEDVVGLGLKQHRFRRNALDTSDRDGERVQTASRPAAVPSRQARGVPEEGWKATTKRLRSSRSSRTIRSTRSSSISAY